MLEKNFDVWNGVKKTIDKKEMIWALPITSTVKDSPFYYRFKFMDSHRSVMLTQIRTISTKRLRRKVDIITDADFEAIRRALCLLIKSETPVKNGGISEPEGTNIPIVEENIE